MKALRTWPWVELAVLAFAAWLARDLLQAWHHSPHDRLGWLALLVWLSPLALRLEQARAETAANFYLLAAAIACGLLGQLTEIHFLNHVALVLALGAWLPLSRGAVPWLLSAVAWLPLLGWALAGCASDLVLILRLLLALAGATSFWWLKKRVEKQG